MNQSQKSAAFLSNADSSTYGSIEKDLGVVLQAGSLDQASLHRTEADLQPIPSSASDILDKVAGALKGKIASRLSAAMAIFVAVGIAGAIIGILAINHRNGYPFAVAALFAVATIVHAFYGTMLFVFSRAEATSMESLGFAQSTDGLPTPTSGKSSFDRRNSNSSNSSDSEDSELRSQFLPPHSLTSPAKSPDIAFVYILSYVRLFFGIFSFIVSCLAIVLSAATFMNQNCDSCGFVVGLIIAADLFVALPSVILTISTTVDFFSLISLINSPDFKLLERSSL